MRNHFLRLIKPKGHLHSIGMIRKTVFYICTDFWAKHCSALWENFVIQYWSHVLKWWFSVSFSLLVNRLFAGLFSGALTLFFTTWKTVLSQWAFFTSIFLPNISIHARTCPLLALLSSTFSAVKIQSCFYADKSLPIY